MESNELYARLNKALITAGMDPAKAMTHPTYSNQFNRLCEETGVRPSAICEAAGL
mgnify:CR=1 FL=1